MSCSTKFRSSKWSLLCLLCLACPGGRACSLAAGPGPSIPLPEHPRPDFQRASWLNLNGPWAFAFDAKDAGEKDGWAEGKGPFSMTITVPFPWGSKLSGVPNEADIGWYSRKITVPADWKGSKVFLVIGACDWQTKAWLDGKLLGSHRGGYTPFEFDITEHLRPGEEQHLVLRVDDTPHPFKLEGKQGYGPARGIWQTAYLEARPKVYLETIHFTPDVDARKVMVKARLPEPAPAGCKLILEFKTGNLPEPRVTEPVPPGKSEVELAIPIPQPRLWSLEDPFLHEVEAALEAPGSTDRVRSYFGMRKVSVVKLPGLGHPYIALNGKPLYLQMTLDQAYHPEGFYTFPSDEFLRDEILRSRRIGLNAMRIHVKIDAPRKLYWADRLGILIMADVPNSWGEPDAEMRKETETALQGMIRRDFNHPAIFSWVIFNETWGLRTKDKGYLPETQEWVASMVRLAKALDPTRIVEDNSPCNNDHVVTDINSWHAYLPGYEWAGMLDRICRDTYPGSKWNFIGGRVQGEEPLLNSECGNVWGYHGSTGDVDWSWDYHIMMDQFRRHPEICGWLYTEHHDVINEWNGYYRFDRSGKITGLADLVDGMSLVDLHSPLYVSPGGELCRDAKPGARASVPLWASFLSERSPAGEDLILRSELHGWDTLGRHETYGTSRRMVSFQPWMSAEIEPLEVDLPRKPCLAVLALYLEDATGAVHHRNFTTFLVADGPSPRDETVGSSGAKVRLLRFAPATFQAAKWSVKQWQVLDGGKVNGAGAGHFEYRIPWPKDLKPDDVLCANLRFEASAKQLFGKDREGASQQEGDYMLGKGTHEPSLNPNSYPMTDTTSYPSAVTVRAGGETLETAGRYDLKDDPADHRGILSWHSQKRDRKLREAGSHGTLVVAPLSRTVLEAGAAAGALTIRLEVDASLPGGLALYGERFGRYPLDPTVALILRAGAEAGDGFVPLFDGKTLEGWEPKGGSARYRAEDGAIVGQTVPNTANSFLCTTKHYADFVLEYEFKCDDALNSGVQVRSHAYDEPRSYESGGKKGSVPAGRVHGYQVEIDPNNPNRMWTGGIYDEGRRGWLYPGSRGGDAAKFTEQGKRLYRKGEWNKVRVEATGPAIKVWLNGELRTEIADDMTPSGFIALQVHGVGGRRDPLEVRWRNLRIKVLGD